MTKILINAKVLQQMLADQPELEAELVKNASDQVAEAFKRKVDASAMVAKMVKSLEEQLSYRHNPVSETAKQIIQQAANEAVKNAMSNWSDNTVKEAVRKAMDGHKIWIQNNLNGIIIEKVNQAMRAATEAAVKGALR